MQRPLMSVLFFCCIFEQNQTSRKYLSNDFQIWIPRIIFIRCAVVLFEKITNDQSIQVSISFHSLLVYVNDCHDELSASPLVTILLYLSRCFFVVEIILEDIHKLLVKQSRGDNICYPDLRDETRDLWAIAYRCLILNGYFTNSFCMDDSGEISEI